MADISFDNTEIAFAYKSDKALQKAHLLFSSMASSTLVKWGTRLTPWAIRAGLPVKGLIKDSIFEQFVGGETLEETAEVAKTLAQYGVGVILDYGVEGKEGEENFEQAKEEFIRVIRYAGSQPAIPFISIKVTGFARFGLLEKMDALAGPDDGYKGIMNKDALTAAERLEWERVEGRMLEVCAAAATNKVGVLVDAEETWIQHTVDALTTRMMERFNREGRAVVYNTVQCYRHDRLVFLKGSYETAHAGGWLLGIKLVRGAYMEKERKRAAQQHYPSPIQPNKDATDRDYNLGLTFCIEHIEDIALIVASHNEYSNLLAARLLEQRHLPANHPHIHYSQLYGMSDNITFNLAAAGCPVSKYLPFGPLGDVVPYLMRRAQENSSVSGQTGRELSLIKKELKRRKKK